MAGIVIPRFRWYQLLDSLDTIRFKSFKSGSVGLATLFKDNETMSGFTTKHDIIAIQFI